MKSCEQMILEAEQKWRKDHWYSCPEHSDLQLWQRAVNEVAEVVGEPPPDRVNPPRFRVY